MRARERWFEVCIAILYLISDLLYGVPGCIWEWLTEQKLAKLRARAVGLCGRTLFSTFVTLSYGEIFKTSDSKSITPIKSWVKF